MEQEDVWPKGCPVFKQRILKKYGSLKFFDPDEDKVFLVHQDRTSFQKKKGANSYELFCTLDNFDCIIDDANQEDMWEVWFCDVAIEEIAKYYNKHQELGVVVYKESEINGSDVDEGGKDNKTSGVLGDV